MKVNLKVIAIVFFSILVNSCRQRDISYQDLLSIDNTHSIENINLKKSLDNIVNDTINFSKSKSEIILLIIDKNLKLKNVCFSKTDYEIFKKNRPDNFKDLKGYSNYKRIPVLLFGDIESNDFFKKKDVVLYDILGNMPQYDINHPPIIYEPRMICIEM